MRPVFAAWSSPRRLGMALFAACLVSLPFLPLLMAGLLQGEVRIGIVFWLLLFGPALAGILLVQLPVKALVRARDWSDSQTRAAVMCANVATTIGVWQIIGRGTVSLAWSAVLAGIAVIAAAIWYALDERAVNGSQSYVEWKRNA